jgi:mono/diheme cytochrome c family protein
MQGGMNRVRLPDGVLNHFTAAAGPAIYRGDRLPADLVGDLLFNEPVGRIVRRAKIVVKDGLTQLQNAYPKSEFIRSTDPLFRPVNIVSTPDGTLYLMDMYVGLIQDAQFVGGPGSYLRRKNEQYELDKQHNMGRIWRITHDGMTPDRTQPRMYAETPAQLVAHLSHPNGWWRDTAQKLLVLKQDKSVVPALKTIVASSTNPLARVHALWTLEGLGSADAALVREMAKSSDPKLRVQAIRVSESLYKAGDKTFANDYRALLKDGDVDVAIQAMLTINVLRLADAPTLTRSMIDTSRSRGVKEIGAQLLRPGSAQGQQPSLADAAASTLNLSPADRAVLARGEATYRELCFSCHGTDGKGTLVAGAADGSTLAPPLAGSPRVQGHRDYVIKVLLAGLTGPVNGTTYNGGAVMVPMGANDDEWIANVASYVRSSFGNSAGFVTPAQVAAVRKSVSRKSPWTEADLLPTIPTLLTNSAEWTLTASHNTAAAAGAISGATATRWDSGAAQQPGMWLQIELPRPTMIAEVQIDASVPAPLFGARGGGPRAGGPGGPGGPGAPPAAPGARGAAAPAQGPIAAGPAGAPAGAAGRGRGGRGGGPPAPGPVGYSLTVSTDGAVWSAPLAQGAGATPTTVMTIKPTMAKFLRITQTGTAVSNEFWGVAQMRVYQAAQR